MKTKLTMNVPLAHRSQLFAFLALSVFACKKQEPAFDASGSFESKETIISSETAGTIKQFDLEEGETLQAGQYLGFVDSTQLSLRKKQLESQINAVLSKKPNIQIQTAALQEQLRAAEAEQKRISNLVRANAATTKQLDDVNTQIDVIKRQLDALKSTLGITTESISKESSPLFIQIEQINDQISKCRITNPKHGMVLTKYAEENEMTALGKPLYKIAELSDMILRVYVSGNQLAGLKLNQKVRVITDDGKGGSKETFGYISWISDKAEFTPKPIQTKEERANMVYAMKVKVKNDGLLKIGMYGEIKF